MMTFRPFAEIGPERWDQVVVDSPEGWAYCTSHWRQLILDVTEWGLDDFSFAACEGERVVGVMPLQYQAASRRMASTGWSAGGPVVANDVAAEMRGGVAHALVDRAQALAREAGAATLEITLSPVRRASLEARWGMNPLVELGFEDLSTQSLIADLRQPEGELWTALSSNARQLVKKAERAGYRVEGGGWPRYAGDYYRVHSETYHRTGVPPHPRRYFDGIARHMAPAGLAELWVGLSPDGQAVAFHNDTRFNGASVYHTGCSETAHLESGVNYLLFWAAMRGAREAGCAWYEIGEIFPAARDGKSRGLTVFKSKFGGELHRYFRGRLAIEQPVAEAIAAAPVAPEPPVEAAQPPVPAPAPPPSPWREWYRASRALARHVIGPRS